MRPPVMHSGIMICLLAMGICLPVRVRAEPAGSAEGTSSQAHQAASTSADPYLWLEDVTGSNALNWVRQQNAIATNELESLPIFEPTRRRLLSLMDSKERIPYVAKH